jgi:hypothetical protein
MMREREIDGKLQVIAAMSLFRLSRLIQWDADSARFTAISHSGFNSLWPEIDPVFGRLVCWINFAMAAEFLAKGVCLLRDVEIRELRNGKTKFGTFGDLQNALKQLCAVVHVEKDQQQAILKGYQRLGSEIRNRDAHAYMPNVRDAHFDIVRDQCVSSFNLLISWLPEGPHEINKWCDDAAQFIASLT